MKLAKLAKLIFRVARLHLNPGSSEIESRSPLNSEGVLVFVHPSFLRAVRQFVWFYMIGHVLGCMQFFIAVQSGTGWIKDAARPADADPPSKQLAQLYSVTMFHTMGQMVMVRQLAPDRARSRQIAPDRARSRHIAHRPARRRRRSPHRSTRRASRRSSGCARS